MSFYSTDHPDYVKRNYAKNVSEYNTVLGSLAAQRRYRTCCLPFSLLLIFGLWLRMLVVIGTMVELGVASDKGLIYSVWTQLETPLHEQCSGVWIYEFCEYGHCNFYKL